MTHRRTALAVALVAAIPLVVVGGGYLGRDHASAHRFATVPLSASPSRVAVIGDSYTTGFRNTGRGAANWNARTWRALAGRGLSVSPDVAAEGGAGYGVRGDHGDLFGDLTSRAVHPDDALVVFFGSLNDRDVDPGYLRRLVADTVALARRITPSARILVIGPPWPDADVPDEMWRIRDVVSAQAHDIGARFVDPLAEGWFADRPDLIGPDGVHPNDAGQAYLADKIVPLIATELAGATQEP